MIKFNLNEILEEDEDQLLEKYELEIPRHAQVLGEGMFGLVVKARDLRDGEVVAVKVCFFLLSEIQTHLILQFSSNFKWGLYLITLEIDTILPCFFDYMDQR